MAAGRGQRGGGTAAMLGVGRSPGGPDLRGPRRDRRTRGHPGRGTTGQGHREPRGQEALWAGNKGTTRIKCHWDKHPWGPGSAGTSGTKGLRAGKSWIRGEGEAQKSGWRGNQGQEISLQRPCLKPSQHGAVVPAMSPKSVPEDSPRSIYSIAFGQPSPVPSLDTPLLLWGTRRFLSCSSYSGGAACSA